MTEERHGAPGSYNVEHVTTSAQLEECYAIRMEVFVAEQQVPAEEELDDLDVEPTTTHLLVRGPGGEAVATGRLLTDPAHPDVVHVGRVAVRRVARGTGVGRHLMEALHERARALPVPARRVELSAQEQALAFYQRLGYAIGEARYLDAGIWHRDAWLELADGSGSVGRGA